MKPSILIFGAGGHAVSCIDVIEAENKFNIAGLVIKDDDCLRAENIYPVVGTEKNLDSLKAITEYAFIGIGQIKDPSSRTNLYQHLKRSHFRLPTIISPNAYVSKHAVLGDGVIVMHGAIVNAGVHIGSNCIINSRALIEHGCLIGDNCHISTGAIINGEVKIGDETFVGSGAVIKQGLSISDVQVIKMGSKIFNSF